MTIILKNKILQLALYCLCLTLFSVAFSQDTSGTTDMTEETVVETSSDDLNSDDTTDTSTEEAVREANAGDVTDEEELTGDSASTGIDAEDADTGSTTEVSESFEVVEESDSSEVTEEVEKTDEAAADTASNFQADNKANERVITVEYSGGNRKTADFRYGPWIYSHPDEEGIVGTVGTDPDSQLTIYAKEAELKAPEDVLIATAGERIANFIGGVRVTRKRLTALGEALEYSEALGFGELTAEEQIEITVVAKEEDGDLTEIKADSATFDVDTDISVSRGGVTLTSGSQSAEAEEITFEQGLDLGVMTSPDGQVTIIRENEDGDGEVVITADIVRVLTESKKLMASGNVELVDGTITTTGEVVFFDDELERAEVFGTQEELAVSIDSEFNITQTGERLVQRIDLGFVEVLDETVASIWDATDFQLTSEKEVTDNSSEVSTEADASEIDMETETDSETSTDTETEENSSE